MKLAPCQLAVLRAVPDEWTLWWGIRVRTPAHKMLNVPLLYLERHGMIESAWSKSEHTKCYRRTDAGGRALEQSASDRAGEGRG